MEVIICPNPQKVGEVSAAKVASVARVVGPSVVLGVATGSSPIITYERLAQMVRSGTLDLSSASAFALDEYIGLPFGHPESYQEVVRRTVTEPLGLDPERVHVPDGHATNLSWASEEYEQAILRAGGVDVQILGTGANGHIGFNEPGSSLSSRTRMKTLSKRTRQDNKRFFSSEADVPKHCLTQGLGTIMDARNIVLVATGENKAWAVSAIVEGPVTAFVPGSVLQFHRKVTVIVDEAAASKLLNSDYYRYAFDNLPDWQKPRMV